jgi:sulfofructose kinase
MAFHTDILGLGAVAVDDLLYVDAYPPANCKVLIRSRERHGGGLTATALVAASRLGAACAYAGMLGKDELSEFVIANLRGEGIDLSYLKIDEAARPVYAMIIVDNAGQRNIFVDLNCLTGAAPDWPPAEVIRSSRVLFVDQIGMPGMLRAARIARAAGIPVVADIEIDSPLFADLLREVDHLILSWEFVSGRTGASNPQEACRALWSEERAVVAVTCGSAGCWYVDRATLAQPQHQQAFPVKAVDTTGCGDVFHGAYAAGLVRGLDLRERIRFAAAAAALKALQRGGQPGAPTLSVLQEFLGQHQEQS